MGYGHALATPLLRYSQILQLKIEVIVVSVFVHSSKEAGAIALGLGGSYLWAS